MHACLTPRELNHAFLACVHWTRSAQIQDDRRDFGEECRKSALINAGPFPIKCSLGCASRSVKGYIALFICINSKAVHLEVVGDLITQSLLATLRLE